MPCLLCLMHNLNNSSAFTSALDIQLESFWKLFLTVSLFLSAASLHQQLSASTRPLDSSADWQLLPPGAHLQTQRANGSTGVCTAAEKSQPDILFCIWCREADTWPFHQLVPPGFQLLSSLGSSSVIRTLKYRIPHLLHKAKVLLDL